MHWLFSESVCAVRYNAMYPVLVVCTCCVCVQAGQGKKEHLYKILVIGDLGTGKTSIIKRYVHQFFSPHYRATVSLSIVHLLCGH